MAFQLISLTTTKRTQVTDRPILFYFNQIWVSKHFNKASILNFSPIRPVGVEMIHADGRTDRHEANRRQLLTTCERVKTGRNGLVDNARLRTNVTSM